MNCEKVKKEEELERILKLYNVAEDGLNHISVEEHIKSKKNSIHVDNLGLKFHLNWSGNDYKDQYFKKATTAVKKYIEQKKAKEAVEKENQRIDDARQVKINYMAQMAKKWGGTHLGYSTDSFCYNLNDRKVTVTRNLNEDGSESFSMATDEYKVPMEVLEKRLLKFKLIS